MGDRQEATVKRFLAAIAGADVDGAVACFSDDARYHVSAWQEPVVGKDAIRTELERQAGIYSDFRSDLVNITSAETLVFTERLDSFAIGPKRITLHWAGVFEVDQSLKISAIRDYYDLKELEAQLS